MHVSRYSVLNTVTFGATFQVKVKKGTGGGGGGGGCMTYTSSWRLSGAKVNMSIGPYGRTSIYRNARDIQTKEQL